MFLNDRNDLVKEAVDDGEVFSGVRSKDSPCEILSRHIESSGKVEQGIFKDAKCKRKRALNFYQTGYAQRTSAECSLEPILTVIHAKYNGSTKKGTDRLKQEVHGKLPPALSSQQTQGEGDRGVQVAACKCT